LYLPRIHNRATDARTLKQYITPFTWKKEEKTAAALQLPHVVYLLTVQYEHFRIFFSLF